MVGGGSVLLRGYCTLLATITTVIARLDAVGRPVDRPEREATNR